jgi:NAD(P)-dependent dehydrogenase (short-subunit alcohol dehydrogenase family)
VLGETLAHELAPFSIRVLVVEPGAFRTARILARPMFEENPIPDYDDMRATMAERYRRVAGHQPGDPVKGMQLVVDVVRGEGRARGRAWPVYLPLGEEAEKAIREKCAALTGVLDEWGEVIRDTRLDHP